jgi:hypothetical protein
MRHMALGLLAPCVIVLAGCPGPDRPEDVEVPPAAEQVQLEALQGSGTTGEVAVTARDNDTHLVVTIRNAMPDQSFDARIHSGTCQNPGPEIANIGSIRTTDAGTGAIESTVGEAPRLLMDGNHIVVIWSSEHPDRAMHGDTMMGTGTTRQPGQVGTDTMPMTGQQGMRQETGLMRNDQHAVACSTLPRQVQ